MVGAEGDMWHIMIHKHRPNLGRTHTGGQVQSPFKKPLPKLGNPTRHLKLGEPITFNFS
jgi:hypothetical protein